MGMVSNAWHVKASIYYVLKPPIWLRARGGKRGKGNDKTLLIGGLIT